jgi:hypothetical protein
VSKQGVHARLRPLARATIASLVLSIAIPMTTGARALADTGPVARQIAADGVTTAQASLLGDDAITDIEIDDFGIDEADAASSGAEGLLGRGLPTAGAGNASTKGGQKAKSNAQVDRAFDGLNFRQQRLANGGNQFSVEPPDQALCVGNGYVLESVNDVLTVFSTTGSQLLGVTDLNTFYGYPPAIKRGSPNRFGPSLTDPTCLFDQATQRWFHVVLTLDRISVDPSTGLSLSQSMTGRNHLDIAASNTSSPLGSWTIYRVPVQDDGTEGTPDHHCAPAPGTPPATRTHPRACLGDYPHIGADANGFYVTTNEFSFFGPGFHAAQVYAFSKGGLASGSPSVTMFQYDTADTPAAGVPGFTVMPATSAASFATDAGGTEYFVSSLAVFFGLTDQLVLWALTNTQALTLGAAPSLSNALVGTEAYGNPPRANQPGSGTNDATKDWPLGQCLQDAVCNAFLGQTAVTHPETIGKLNANDSRVGQVTYANGKLWTALSTGIVSDTDPSVRVGVAYFVLLPQPGLTLKAKVVKQGYLAVDGASLIFPTTAATESGRGLISFTFTGNSDMPSAGFVSLDAVVGAGPVQIAKAGVGLQDSFSEYTNVFGGRPRWGDYGAAAVDGNSIWFATEYIAQSCNLTTYEAGFGASFGSCGGTRTSLGNWATRITKATP